MGNALEHWPLFFAVDALRYAIPASLGFAVFWLWKWDALSHRRIQKRRPSRNAFRREILYSISTAVIFSGVGVATFALVHAGVLHMYFRVDDYGWPWFFASIVLAILIHDTYFYWTHRAIHHPWLFKRVHRVHHLSTSPSPWAAYAFAPPEALINALVFPLILLVVPMHELAGFVFLIYMITMNVIGHLGIELYPRGFTTSRWTRWYSTSTHHNLHHRDFHGNYGLYFTWWDRMMRTQHEAYQQTFAQVTSRSEETDVQTFAQVTSDSEETEPADTIVTGVFVRVHHDDGRDDAEGSHYVRKSA
ncbi:MAG TPA: sterol desaturase family protein [Kofleriaceae bacterium]|nr:sterol desaturase family protein [Kofleriaceae bacterium]